MSPLTTVCFAYNRFTGEDEMKHFIFLLLAILLVCSFLPGPVSADEAFDRQVEQAIDRGAQFFLDLMQNKTKGPDAEKVGQWKAVDGYPMGAAAVQLYAIVKSDIPHNHPVVQQGLEVLTALPFQKTYSVALYIMALDAVLKQMNVDMVLGARVNRKMQFEVQEKLQAATNWLVRARWDGDGSWNYGMEGTGKGRYDHSNTQFAILGLGVAYKRGIKIPVDVWTEVMDHFIATQEADGPEVKSGWQLKEPEQDPRTKRSRTAVVKHAEKTWAPENAKVFARGWSYQDVKGEDKKGVTFNMSCAGASSVLVAYDALKKLRGFRGPKREALEKSIRDGVGKLITFMDGKNNWTWGGLGGCYYSLYSLEKVGDIGGIEKFGSFDWYRLGAQRLLELQDKKFGCWGDTEKKGNVNYQTALALLFLARATDLTFHNRPLVKQITGRTAKQRDDSSRDWVFLPSMQLEVPVRRIYRKLRYMPTRKLLRMAEGIVEHYDPEHKPELIPIILDTYEKTPFKAIKKVLMEGIEEITGMTSTDNAVYVDFMKRWDEVIKAGKERDSSKVPQLLTYLKESKSPVLKTKILWAVMRANATETIGTLIGYMNDDDLAVRKAAYSAVRFLSRQNFPYSPGGSSARREQQIQAWTSWWKKQ